jgi:hypothetical protein
LQDAGLRQAAGEVSNAFKYKESQHEQALFRFIDFKNLSGKMLKLRSCSLYIHSVASTVAHSAV